MSPPVPEPVSRGGPMGGVEVCSRPGAPGPLLSRGSHMPTPQAGLEEREVWPLVRNNDLGFNWPCQALC